MKLTPLDVKCPNCQAKPGQSCTAPDNTGRHPIRQYHLAREAEAEKANEAAIG